MAAAQPIYPGLGSTKLQAYISISDILKDLINSFKGDNFNKIKICLKNIIDDQYNTADLSQDEFIRTIDNERLEFEKAVLSVNPDINKFLISGLDKYPYVNHVFTNKLPSIFTNFFHDQGSQPIHLASNENNANLIMNPGKCMDPGPTSLGINKYTYPFDQKKHEINMKPYGFNSNVIFKLKFTIPNPQSEQNLTCEIWIQFKIGDYTYEYNTTILQNSNFAIISPSQGVLEELNIINAADDTVIQRLFQHTRDGGGRIFSTPPNPNPNPYTSKMYGSNGYSLKPAFFIGNNEKNTFIDNANPSQPIDMVISTLYILCKVFGDLLQAVFAQQLLVADNFTPILTRPQEVFTNENTSGVTHDNMLAARFATLNTTVVLTSNAKKYSAQPNYSGAVLYTAGNVVSMNIEMIETYSKNIGQQNKNIIDTFLELVDFDFDNIDKIGIDALKPNQPKPKQLTNIVSGRGNPVEKKAFWEKVIYILRLLVNDIEIIQTQFRNIYEAINLHKAALQTALQAAAGADIETIKNAHNIITINGVGYDMAIPSGYDELKKLISMYELNELIKKKPTSATSPIRHLYEIGCHKNIFKHHLLLPSISLNAQTKLNLFIDTFNGGISLATRHFSSSVYELIGNEGKPSFERLYTEFIPLLNPSVGGSRSNRGIIRYPSPGLGSRGSRYIPPTRLPLFPITPSPSPEPRGSRSSLSPSPSPGPRPSIGRIGSRRSRPLSVPALSSVISSIKIMEKSDIDIKNDVYNILYEIFEILGIIMYHEKIFKKIIKKVKKNEYIDIHSYVYLFLKKIYPIYFTYIDVEAADGTYKYAYAADVNYKNFVFIKNFKNRAIIPLLIDQNYLNFDLKEKDEDDNDLDDIISPKDSLLNEIVVLIERSKKSSRRHLSIISEDDIDMNVGGSLKKYTRKTKTRKTKTRKTKTRKTKRRN